MSDTFPGFYYYGRKKQLSKHYPPPLYSRIIEPFAGAAGYACKYPHCNVTLIDNDVNIVETWKFLIGATRRDIMKLPILQRGESLDDEKFKKLPIGAKCFIGFNLGVSPRPHKQPQGYCHWTTAYRQRVADSIHLINHWKVSLGSYTLKRNCKATWFIDPPYSGYAGKAYRKNNSNLDYKALAKWVRKRKGLVIVCENASARWLPFKPLKLHMSTSHDMRVEGVFILHKNK